MIKKSKAPTLFQIGGTAALLCASIAFAAQEVAQDPKQDPNQELTKVITDSSDFYKSQQAKKETSIPDWVVKKAKGVIILTRWSGAAGIGGTSGAGIGMKKDAGGKFSSPAFYTVAGASIGLQLGGGKTQSIAFLMSDNALNTLTDSKFVWSGNVRAVAGDQSTSDTTVDNKTDVILYQQSSGLDAGATVSATQISIDDAGNRKIYDNALLTPSDVFAGKVKTPEAAKTLLEALDKQGK